MNKLKLILIAATLFCVYQFLYVPEGNTFCGGTFNGNISQNNMPKPKTPNNNSAAEKSLYNHLVPVRELISKNPEYNDKIAFFVDMKIPSGKNRFFVYDLKANKVIDKGLVAHGAGSETGTIGKLKFSNVVNSFSTSLGKYYIGRSYIGDFGKAYRLHGLDKTNDNAFVRNIVLHKYSKMPYNEQEKPICQSYGCPMVNEKYFKKIEGIIDNSEKNIIMYIYY